MPALPKPIDKYELQAQYIPAMLCSAPFVALGVYYIAQMDTSFWNSILTQAFSGISMTFALYFLAAFACRHVGKWFEDLIFNKGSDYPTTKFLLDGDTNLSEDRKAAIRRKVNTDFDIQLGGEDTAASRKLIYEAVGQIRCKFFKVDNLVRQRNIQFGFSKNIAGGSVLALMASVIGFTLGIANNLATPTKVSAVLFLMYGTLMLFGLAAIRPNGRRFAEALYDEYLAS